MEEWQKNLIEYLVKKEAILFGDFKLKSGRHSPYFFNLANAMRDGEGIMNIAEAYSNAIISFIGLDKTDYIHGPAYKGIPLAGATAAVLFQKHHVSKRWGYDRKEPKTYGAEELWLVGDIQNGDRILIVDDVATTGKTKIDAINRILDSSGRGDLTFIGILIMLDRKEVNEQGVSTSDYLKEQGLTLYSILDAPLVFDYMRGRSIEGRIYVDEEKYRDFQEYFKEFGVES
ncbi:MAG: orotate phosphoribosyltransferase [Candidatus Hodarchaeota archaeon]